MNTNSTREKSGFSANFINIPLKLGYKVFFVWSWVRGSRPYRPLFLFCEPKPSPADWAMESRRLPWPLARPTGRRGWVADLLEMEEGGSGAAGVGRWKLGVGVNVFVNKFTNSECYL